MNFKISLYSSTSSYFNQKFIINTMRKEGNIFTANKWQRVLNSRSHKKLYT